MKYKLRVLPMHEIGKRDNQEDCMYPSMAGLSDDCRSFVVCDGLGGHDSGEVASAAVCRAIGTYIEKNCNTGAFAHEDFLKALSAAYDELDACDTGARKKMGTTMTFLNFGTAGCLVAHIGDSRVYHMRPGDGILFETRDHSLVNDLLKMGELTPEEAKVFPQRNTVTRCMQPGREVRPKADIRHIADVRAGDYFFMCSDGVNEVLESCDLAGVILDTALTDEEKMVALVQGTAEARDNHTAFLVHVLDVVHEPGDGTATAVAGNRAGMELPLPESNTSVLGKCKASVCWLVLSAVVLLLAVAALFFLL